MIFNILEKQLSPSENSVLEKSLSFRPKTLGYSKLKQINDLFQFCRDLQPREFFHKNTVIDTDSNNTVYNKTQESTDISKQPKNRSFNLQQNNAVKLNQYIPSIKDGIDQSSTKFFH